MKTISDFEGKIVEIFYNDNQHETGKLMGIDGNFIFLENRIFFVETSQIHASMGDAWLSLVNIKQISIMEEDSDIVEKHRAYEENHRRE